MSEQTETITEVLGFDTEAMCKVVGEWIASCTARMIADDFVPSDMVSIREDVMELTKFGAAVSSELRNLRETFDKFVGLLYETEQLDPTEVQKIHVPTERKGAGRKPMTPEERIKAFQKRVVSGDKD